MVVVVLLGGRREIVECNSEDDTALSLKRKLLTIPSIKKSIHPASLDLIDPSTGRSIADESKLVDLGIGREYTLNVATKSSATEKFNPLPQNIIRFVVGGELTRGTIATLSCERSRGSHLPSLVSPSHYDSTEGEYILKMKIYRYWTTSVDYLERLYCAPFKKKRKNMCSSSYVCSNTTVNIRKKNFTDLVVD